MWELGISELRRLATPMWDSGESNAASVGVRMICAPNAFKTSTLIYINAVNIIICLNLFLGHFFRKSDDHFVSFNGCRQSKSNPFKYLLSVLNTKLIV